MSANDGKVASGGVPSSGKTPWSLDFGANLLGNGKASFRVWAPRTRHLSVRIISDEESRIVPLQAEGNGYFSGILDRVGDGDRYLYLLDDGSERPDPASRYQPEGVHAPSQVLNSFDFFWSDTGWRGVELDDYIIYELHIGTFTPEGTFDASIQRLDYLVELGVTALELMPVAQFPGGRNWGYDGVYPFAPQNSYGGPEGLKRLVDACHSRGLAVILDLVCNHLGPEGNYTNCFGYYFTDRYRTPWGDAVNFDGPESDPVRHFFLSNALYWICEFHVDALRIDAIHGIYDFSASPFLTELAVAVHRLAESLGRRPYLIAESSLNDVRTVTPPQLGGNGLDSQWNDDLHHALHTLLTGEREGYYTDFGRFSQLGKAYREGFVYSGQYSVFRRRRHGSSSALIQPGRFVVFSQNHDQVGNRLLGDRLSRSLAFEKLKLAAGTVLLSPYVPLLFMGEEYGETAPFPYFTSHGDPELAEAVRRGRREEFAAFAWQGEVPDPQAEETFLSAKIDPELRHGGVHALLFRLYRELIRLRKGLKTLRRLVREDTGVTGFEPEQVLVMRRWFAGDECLSVFNFSGRSQSVPVLIRHGSCLKFLDSAEKKWGGGGSPAAERLPAGVEAPLTLAPWSFALYSTETIGE